MANRFPLILDTTDGNKIKEIPAGDNLDLRNVSIVDAQNIDALGTINAAAITINGNQIQPGTFTDLDDTPENYAGSEGLFVRVKADGTGLEFYELGGDEAELFVTNIQVSQSILPDEDVGASVGGPANRFDGVYANFLQGSIKGNDGSTVFDATTNEIPYAVIAGAPQTVGDLENDEGYIRAVELRAVIPEFIQDGLVQVEVTNTGDLIGSVFGEDSTLLVDHLNSRINAARLTQNGALNGQTIVWNETTQVWEPGIAGDITGFSSNKTDTLTVETGYSITYQDTTGTLSGDVIQIDTATRLEVNEVQVQGDNDIYPAVNGNGSVGRSGLSFGEAYINTVNATTVVGDLTGSATGDLHKANIGVFGDKTAGNGGYQLHVLGEIGVTGGNLWMNGGNINGANLVNVTGDFRGSFFGDDSTIIIDGVNNSITGNLQFPTAIGTITGTVIQINASDKVTLGNTESTGDIFPFLDESGKIGTVARRYDEGNFVTLRAENFSIDTVTANVIETQNFLLSGTGTGTIESATDLVLQTGNRARVEGGPFKFVNLSQANIDLIVTQAGDTVYNTDDNRFQFYQNGAWVSLHTGVFEGSLIGSVVADDSTPIIDGVSGKVIAPTVTGDATFENNVVVSGNLTVQGTTTSIETTNTEITDNTILLNKGETGAGVTNLSAGIEIDRGSEANVEFIWDEGIDRWSIGARDFTALGLYSTSVTGTGVGDITQYANITGPGSGTVSGYTNLTGTSGGTISGFTTLTGDTGGTISGFTNITGDTGGTISGFTTLTGDTGGDITGFLNVTGDTGGTISGFTNITGDTGGTISGFTTLTGDGGGSITGFDIGWTLISSTPTTLAGYGITDAATSAQGTNADTAFGWGDHAAAGYQSATDPFTGDVKGSVFGDDSSVIVDAVNNTLTGNLTGDVKGSVSSDNGSVTLVDGTAGKIVGPITKIVGDMQSITGPGAISIDTLSTEITTTGADAFTLADGTLGQMKTIVMLAHGGDATITPTTFANGSEIVFDAALDSVTLLYTTNGWMVLAAQNATINP